MTYIVICDCITKTNEHELYFTDGYAKVAGVLSTTGAWLTVYSGCGNTYYSVGDTISFRFGGGPSHAGEFVHTSCNDYTTDAETRPTSRW